MIVDLFAGPGGWDEGLRLLGRHEDCVGIEWDASACSTAIAAGHQRICTDVAAYPLDVFAPGGVEGLIASPPCQSFSAAGKRRGLGDKEHIIRCAHEIAAGFDSRHQYGHLLEDERSLLTVEPLRWALALRPRWIAFEQVPAVLELWTLFAGLLAEHGYESAVGVLSAEQYGVPQTRKRAYLIASLDGPVALPEATHSKYYGRDPRRLDEGVLPWVSMAEALGWGMCGRPAHTVTGGGTATGGAEPFGNGARQQQRKAMERGEWKVRTGNFSAVARDDDGERSKAGSVPYERDVDAPAPTLTGTAQRWTLEQPTHLNPRQVTARQQQVKAQERGEWTHLPDRRGWKFRADVQKNAAVRDVSEPAPTIRFGHSCAQMGWTPDGGDVRKGGIRITTEEASLLMGFEPGYPWQGSKTKQFQQIGNAVCPPIGARVLAEAMRLDGLRAAA